MSVEHLYELALAARSDIQGHLEVLYEHAASRPAAVVIEAGVRAGVSTRALLAGVRASGGQLWSVDIRSAAVPGEIIADERWHFLQASDLSREALEWLPAEADVVFLDAHADHWTAGQVRDQVLAELEAFVPRVRPGGVVLLHDTQWEPPNIDRGEPAGGVARALDEYCAAHQLAWQNRPGSYGLGVLQIPQGG